MKINNVFLGFMGCLLTGAGFLTTLRHYID